jgi:hypothetical protein
VQKRTRHVPTIEVGRQQVQALCLPSNSTAVVVRQPQQVMQHASPVVPEPCRLLERVTSHMVPTWVTVLRITTERRRRHDRNNDREDLAVFKPSEGFVVS